MKDTVKPVMEMSKEEYDAYVQSEIKKQIDGRKNGRATSLKTFEP